MVLIGPIHRIAHIVLGDKKEKSMQKKSWIASLFGIMVASVLGHPAQDVSKSEAAVLVRETRIQQLSSIGDQSPLLFSKLLGEARCMPSGHYSHASHSSHRSHFSHVSHRSSY